MPVYLLRSQNNTLVIWLVNMSTGSYKCPMCQFETPTMALNLSHLRLLHSNDPRFRVQCSIGGCSYTGVSFSALYSHIYCRHPNSGIIEKCRRQEQIVDDGDATLSEQPSSTLAFPDCKGRGEDFPGMFKSNLIHLLIFTFTTFTVQMDFRLTLIYCLVQTKKFNNELQLCFF